MNGPQRTAQFVSHRTLPELPSQSNTFLLNEPSETHEHSAFHRQKLSHSIKEENEDSEYENTDKIETFYRQRGVSQISIAEDEDASDCEIGNGSKTKSHFTRRSRRNSLGSMSQKMEVNLQKFVCRLDGINFAAMPCSDTEWTFVSETDYDAPSTNKDSEEWKMRRFVTLRGFEIYLRIKSMLRLFSLIAIAFLQFVYFRYFFLLALLSTVCSIGYCLLCLRFFARKIKQNFIFIFALLIL